MKQPTLYIPHGGGPCFFMEWTIGPRDTWDRMAGWLRGQVGYTYDRYVPGAGYAHVASTKWTLSFWEHLQTWVAASAQLDVPGSGPSQVYGILTLGVEVSF